MKKCEHCGDIKRTACRKKAPSPSCRLTRHSGRMRRWEGHHRKERVRIALERSNFDILQSTHIVPTRGKTASEKSLYRRAHKRSTPVLPLIPLPRASSVPRKRHQRRERGRIGLGQVGFRTNRGSMALGDLGGRACRGRWHNVACAQQIAIARGSCAIPWPCRSASTAQLAHSSPSSTAPSGFKHSGVQMPSSRFQAIMPM